MKKCTLFLVIGVMLSLLAACGGVPEYMKNPAIHELSNQQKQLLGRIQNAGIQIVKRGMIFKFIVPTDQYFSHTTHALRASRERDLLYLGEFVRSYAQYFAYPKISVEGHTGAVWIYPESKLLSLHYAQVVAAYLSQAGVMTKMIVKGKGAKGKVASNQYPAGTVYNRRVVVTVW